MDTREKCIDAAAWLKFRSNRAENAKPERLNLIAFDREEGNEKIGSGFDSWTRDGGDEPRARDWYASTIPRRRGTD